MSRGYVREVRRTSRTAGMFGVGLAPAHLSVSRAARASCRPRVGAGLATPGPFIGPEGMALDSLVGACAVAAVLLSPQPAASLHETRALGPHEGLRPARDAELAQHELSPRATTSVRPAPPSRTSTSRWRSIGVRRCARWSGPAATCSARP